MLDGCFNDLPPHYYVVTFTVLYIPTGTANEFKRKFENPILRGRDADATDSDRQKGEEKLQEVFKVILYPQLVQNFLLI